MAVLEDRVSARPGRMLIKPEDGAEFYATLEMADEPRAPGNKLNRQNVIDTLLPISENGGVGTVILSTVQNPDGRWLPCDGREIKAAESPELFAVLPERPLSAVSVREVKVANVTRSTCGAVRYVNGYYITQLRESLWYTDDLSKEWTEVANVFNSSEASLKEIIFAGGYWVALADDRYSNPGISICYAEFLDGPWEKGWYSAYSGAWNPVALEYIAGTFYAVYGVGNQLNVVSATDPGSWTSIKDINIYVTPHRVQYSYKRGRWELLAGGDSSNSAVYLWHSSNLIDWELTGSIGIAETSNFCDAVLGIDEEYWNLTRYDDLYRISWDAGEYEALGYGGASGVGYVCCDGAGEMWLARGHCYARQSKDEDFVEVDAAPFSGVPGYGNDVPLACGGFAVAGSNGVIYFFDGIYLHYLPSITVPDAKGLTNAYIKAK